jgi:hypothetical protein
VADLVDVAAQAFVEVAVVARERPTDRELRAMLVRTAAELHRLAQLEQALRTR